LPFSRLTCLKSIVNHQDFDLIVNEERYSEIANQFSFEQLWRKSVKFCVWYYTLRSLKSLTESSIWAMFWKDFWWSNNFWKS